MSLDVQFLVPQHRNEVSTARHHPLSKSVYLSHPSGEVQLWVWVSGVHCGPQLTDYDHPQCQYRHNHQPTISTIIRSIRLYHSKLYPYVFRVKMIETIILISMVSYGIPSYPPQKILINRPHQVKTAKQIGCSWEISLTSKA